MGIIENKETKTLERNFRKADRFLVLAMFICGTAYSKIILGGMAEGYGGMGIGFTIFNLVIFLLTYIYLKENKNGVQNINLKRGFWWAAVWQIAAINFAIYDNGPWIENLLFLLVTFSFFQWLSVSSGNDVAGSISEYTPIELLHQTMQLPMYNLTTYPECLRSIPQNGKSTKGALYILLGSMIAFPLAIYTVKQLIVADESFKMLIRNISYFNIDVYWCFDWLLHLVAGLIIGAYLFSSIYSNKYRLGEKNINKEAFDETANVFKKLNIKIIYVILVIFIAIYALFFASKLMYGEETLSYAQYARKGFFELCKVAGINLFLIVFMTIFGKRDRDSKSKVEKVLVGMLCVFTIMLIFNALHKMYRYIEAFGLTQLRIYTSWFMLVLMIICILMIARQVFKFNLIKYIAIVGIAGMLIISYADVDGNIARYNISQYKAGNLESLDYNKLGELSYAAVPHIYELYISAENETERENAKNQFAFRMYSLNKIQNWNYQFYQACKVADRYETICMKK